MKRRKKIESNGAHAAAEGETKASISAATSSSSSLVNMPNDTIDFPDPIYMKFHLDNPYMLSGFRPMPTHSVSACLFSLFRLHNDTINIWSHIIAAIFYLYQWRTYVLELRVAGEDEATLATWSAAMLGQVVVYSGSAFYHTMRSHSHGAFDSCLMIDLSGIMVSIGALNVFLTHEDLRCYTNAQFFWLLVDAALLLLNVVAVNFFVRYRLFNLRTAFGIIFCGFPSIIIVHRTILTRRWTWNNTLSLSGIAASWAISAFALVLRSIKWPERYHPRRFDLFGASHQIFHCLAAISAMPIFIAYRKMILQGRDLCLE